MSAASPAAERVNTVVDLGTLTRACVRLDVHAWRVWKQMEGKPHSLPDPTLVLAILQLTPGAESKRVLSSSNGTRSGTLYCVRESPH